MLPRRSIINRIALSVARRKRTDNPPPWRLHDQAIERRLDLTQLHSDVLAQRFVVSQVLRIHAAHGLAGLIDEIL
jgi:hypothetical protein